MTTWRICHLGSIARLKSISSLSPRPYFQEHRLGLRLELAVLTSHKKYDLGLTVHMYLDLKMNKSLFWSTSIAMVSPCYVYTAKSVECLESR